MSLWITLCITFPYGQNCPPIRNPYDKIVKTVGAYNKFSMMGKQKRIYHQSNPRLKDYLILKDVVAYWIIHTSKQEIEEAWRQIQEYNYQQVLAYVWNKAHERREYGTIRQTDNFILALNNAISAREEETGFVGELTHEEFNSGGRKRRLFHKDIQDEKQEVFTNKVGE